MASMKLCAALLLALSAGEETAVSCRGMEQMRSVVITDDKEIEAKDSTSLLQRGAGALASPLSKATLAHATDPADNVAHESNPLRSTLSSIGAVVVIYIITYDVLLVTHCINKARGNLSGPLEKAMESAIMGVAFAPMLCVLFLSVYKRADTLTMHHPEKYELPQNYVDIALPVCVVAFAMQMVLYVIKEWTINKQDASGVAPGNQTSLWVSLHNLAAFVMYVSAIIVIVGLVFMSQPSDLVDSKGELPLSTGVFCCNCLVVLYFAVYAFLHIIRMIDYHWRGRTLPAEHLTDKSRYLYEVFKIAATVLQSAPMLSVLFIAIELTVDAGEEPLSDVTETCMYLCTFLLVVQVAVAVITPFATGAKLKASPQRAELVDFETNWPRLFTLMSSIKNFCMMATYLALFVIAYYAWTAEDMPVWRILVVHLATFYFLVYLFFYLTVATRSLMARNSGMDDGIKTMMTAKDAVAFCPMLAILLMYCWAKATSIKGVDGKSGQPQGYAQDGMFLATFGTVVVEAVRV
eukprot:TRINITY_DN7689_c0_g1_i1.p1 TRINITY_DN7689_c0_g1~~TRINITY_DN7689_c0_g1_i1.p1  ORF type:complete len:521 (+),score=87.42 TRINITY_DN7689_c0_g1_i1:133-1695(+)